MKFLHTADWHLGKVLKNASLLHEQAHLLRSAFLYSVVDESPDAVIISGDIFEIGVRG